MMEEEDELDPRIQVELEKLNSATDVINKLEIELDEANTTFRMLLNECTRRLKVHSSKHGSSIENARPYYEALDIARQAQQDCQQAAVSFQRANEVHEAAKETVALAESRFMSQQPEWRFDSAWQEMLNHATIKVRDAEKQRSESSAYHSQATARYKDAQEKVQLLEQRLRRNVAKSRPYFEEKQRCNEQLTAQKEAVETLAAKVARIKSEYAESLRRLEGISEEIHRKRGNMQPGGCGVREPGVGAELEYKGEQNYCDTSREATFDKTSYNYDAKFNANNLPDVAYGIQIDSVTNNSVTRTKDCNVVSYKTTADSLWVDTNMRQDVGNFQSYTNTIKKIPGVHNDIDSRCEIPNEIVPDNHTSCGVERKISFDSLHGLYFNPTKDVPHDGKPGDILVGENDVSADVCADVLAELVPLPSSKASSSVSQGNYGLPANSKVYGEAVVIGQGVGQENGAKDNNSDIKEEVENNTTTNVDYSSIKSTADMSRTCDQLKAVTLCQGNKGAKNENVDIIEVTRGTLMNNCVFDDLCAQGDAGPTLSSLTNETPATTVDDLQQKQTTSRSEDCCVAEQKSTPALEYSNTFSRSEDLELTFQLNKTQHQDNDGGTTLEFSANTQSEVEENEVPNEIRDLSN